MAKQQRDDLIMPIHELYAKQILNGVKRYEIRTRDLKFPVGTRIWAYATANSRDSKQGAVLGSFIFKGSDEICGARQLRDIALEATATAATLRRYLGGTHGWAIEVDTYRRFKNPREGTIPNVFSTRRLANPALRKQLEARPSTKPRRPRSWTELRARAWRLGKRAWSSYEL